MSVPEPVDFARADETTSNTVLREHLGETLRQRQSLPEEVLTNVGHPLRFFLHYKLTPCRFT